MTYQMSLRRWDQVGSISRETGLYRALSERGLPVGYFTYGGPEEVHYRERIGAAAVLCNAGGWDVRIYRRLGLLIYLRKLRSFAVFKTNQTNGAVTAVQAGALARRPVIARSGYCLSLNNLRSQGPDHPNTLLAIETERRVYARSARVVVTTEDIADYVRDRYPFAARRVVVIPNAIDTELFAPDGTTAKDFDVAYVGRLHPEKNVETLLEAVQDLPLRVLIVGSGPQEDELRERFATVRASIAWRPRVPNEKLPNYLRRSRVFVMPSKYEGHPKAILEAMSCGVPVLGSDAPGIRELVRHDRLGWLSEDDAGAMRAAIQHLLEREELRERLGNAGREFILQNFSLATLADREAALIREVAEENLIPQRAARINR